MNLALATLAFALAGGGAPNALLAAQQSATIAGTAKDEAKSPYPDYSVRARPGAPVALPLDWKELKTLKSADQFTIPDALNRLKNKRSPPKK